MCALRGAANRSPELLALAPPPQRATNSPRASASQPLCTQAANELQRSGAEAFTLEDIDFGRRLAVERELASSEQAPPPNAVFDESGNFLL